MIPYQNCEIYVSVLFFFSIKIFCRLVTLHRSSMNNKRDATLTSIPERNENEKDMVTKWVSKNKHEVLKAKYKCLKKLFQIYDASVIGILPETYATEDVLTEEVTCKKRRRKRSHLTKTDACAGTTEMSSGDVTQRSSNKSIATSIVRDLKKNQCNTSTQMEAASMSKLKYAPNQDKYRQTIVTDKESGCPQTGEAEHPMPYLIINEKPKLTRFQCFVQRIFGIRSERRYTSVTQPNGHIYAVSDNNIFNNLHEKRRRRGLRLRRLRRPKKVQSECMLRDFDSPVILTYVQSVQRSCLMDTTQRQCPIVGCRMVSFGIINYNDHLNLCHFPHRKFVCHYCHEGFEVEYERFIHENEHIGINKLNESISSAGPTKQKVSITQTDPQKSDVPEDKLKKIVSFFDKINDPDIMLSELKKDRYSESNLQTTLQSITVTDTIGQSDSNSTDSDKRTVTCVNYGKMGNEGNLSTADSEETSKHTFSTPVACHLCGEKFSFRRQLSMHVDLEHRVYNKFSKFHSCAGILNSRAQARTISENGRIKIESIDKSSYGRDSSSTVSEDTYSEVSRRKSEESLSCDPSTNIIYYTSFESVKKPSVINNVMQKLRSVTSYKWEPETKIIRV